MLRVLYDVSLLGIAQRNRSTFGLSRTSASLLQALSQRPDVALTAYSDLSFEVWLHSKLYCLRHAPAPGGKPLAWLRNAMTITLDNAGITTVLDEQSVLRQWQQLQTQGILVDGLSPAAWRKRLACGALQGVSAACLDDFDICHSSYHPVAKAARGHSRLRCVLTVHDVIPLLHPEWFSMLGEGTRRYFHPEFDLPATLATVTPDTWLICPSQTSRDDLCNQLGTAVDPDKIAVIPWAASKSFYPCTDTTRLQAVRQRYRLPEGDYLLSLCTIEPRKNLGTLIESFSLLLQQQHMPDLNLVLAGPWGWDFQGLFESLRQRPHLNGRVVFTGHVAEDDLAALYSGARVFVYPSLYEGFGLPPLEAMQCGTPVVTYNATSLPEVVGDGGLMVDIRNPQTLADALWQICASSTLRAKMAAQALTRAQAFSWKRCAQETLAHYRRACG